MSQNAVINISVKIASRNLLHRVLGLNTMLFGQNKLMESETPNCPHCRRNNFNHIRYLPFKREIDSMKVHCPRKYSGCNMQVAYGNRVDQTKPAAIYVFLVQIIVAKTSSRKTNFLTLKKPVC